MKKTQHTKKKISYFWYYVLTLIMLFAVSTSGSYVYFKPKVALNSAFIEDLKSQRPKKESIKDETDLLRLYKNRSQEENTLKAQRESLLITVEDMIKQYMKPYGVALLDLYMDKKGTVYADFNNELRKNFDGDAYEEYKIIAGLYRSIKQNVSGFRAIKILIEGQEIDSLGGHIDISEPIGKAIEQYDWRHVEGAF
jgi:hypothetical protein